MTKTRKSSLAETHPEIAAQAEGWDPTTLTAGSNKTRTWKCEEDHSWNAPPADRVRGQGCPFCAGKRAWPGFNDLASINPTLAAQACGWDPTTTTPGSGSERLWQCQHGHEWLAKVSDRSRGNGCPYCSGLRTLQGVDDLATTHPELALEAHGWDPTTLKAGSNKRVEWKCSNGHVYTTALHSRGLQGTDCPICSNQQLLVGYNDLVTTHPDLAAQADGWDPTTVVSGTNKKLSWLCKVGHSWIATVNSRTLQKTGCPICANKQVLAGYNDLATTHPELAAQADGWDPTTVTANSAKKRMWKCNRGHSWLVSVDGRRKGQAGCPICANQQLLVGYNDLATTHPELALEADGWDPRTVIAGSNKKAKWICEQGHRWSSVIANRSRVGVGCPSCAKFGFDPNQPGFLYLIDHFELDMFQIGITNFPDKRLDKHGRSGWEVIELRGPMDGLLTRQLETNCLHALEQRGAILGHKAGIDKFDGYSEAWTKASLNVTSIKQILDWVYEDESK